MKKITYILLALTCLFCACGKEGTSLRIRTEAVGGNQKAYLDANYVVCFSAGDAVKINGTSVSMPQAGNQGTVEVDRADTYWAVYPAGIVNGTVSGTNNIPVNLPATQTYSVVDGHQVIQMPMAAYAGTSDGDLYFRNLCALLKVNVKNSKGSTLTVTKIVVKSNNTALSGTGTISEINGGNGITAATPSISLASNQSKEVALTMNVGISNGNTQAFYIVIPKVESTANRFTIEVQGTLNSKSVKFLLTQPDGLTNTAKYTIARNQLGAAAFDVNMDPYQPPFSVSATKKVIFAPGNLCSDNGGGNWRFQPNQWTQSVLNPRGMFYFSNEVNNDYGINWVSDGSTFRDWGNVFPSTDGWFTLSYSEWHYLLYERENHDDLWRAATKVNGVSGFLLLPDGWSGTISSSYSGDSWTVMEQEGAVFLPRSGGGQAMAGQWPGSYGMYIFGEEDWVESIMGEYWTYDGGKLHTTLYFNTNNSRTDDFSLNADGWQGNLRAVRLAKEVH